MGSKTYGQRRYLLPRVEMEQEGELLSFRVWGVEGSHPLDQRGCMTVTSIEKVWSWCLPVHLLLVGTSPMS